MAINPRPRMAVPGPRSGSRTPISVETPTETAAHAFPTVVEFDRSDWPRWLAEHRETIEQLTSRSGAVLLKRTPIASPEAFSHASRTLYDELLSYNERSSPRQAVGDNIYTSTEYPSDRSIPLHNENSYQSTWPRRIAFCCLTPSTTRGATPLADCRKVLGLIAPAIVSEFRAKGILYVRNFRPGLGLAWQTTFQTTDQRIVEEYCRQAGLSCEWLGQDALRVSSRREALARHPGSGELVWFNHAVFFHDTSLDPDIRSSLLADYQRNELPNNAFYGDGSPIPDEVISLVRAAYQEATITRDWAAGDLLLLDNMLVAHGREPFTGSRRVLVAMAHPTSDRHLV